MPRFTVFVFSFLFSITAFCKTIVISDIDDTLRSLHTGADYLELLDNASDSRRAFRGMSEVLGDLDRNGAEIFYVSAVVEPFTGMSVAFLEDNEFPQSGNFFSKGWFEDTVDFKVARIEDILNSHPADTILLLGDNGDHDVEVYSRIAGEFSNSVVFIHKLFTGNLEAGQNIFLTAADLAVSLADRGLFTADQRAAVVQHLDSDLQSGDEFTLDMIWPSWAVTSKADVDAVYGTDSTGDLDSIKTYLLR